MFESEPNLLPQFWLLRFYNTVVVLYFYTYNISVSKLGIYLQLLLLYYCYIMLLLFIILLLLLLLLLPYYYNPSGTSRLCNFTKVVLFKFLWWWWWIILQIIWIYLAKPYQQCIWFKLKFGIGHMHRTNTEMLFFLRKCKFLKSSWLLSLNFKPTLFGNQKVKCIVLLARVTFTGNPITISSSTHPTQSLRRRQVVVPLLLTACRVWPWESYQTVKRVPSNQY